jgi:hypothetical protein
MNLLSLIGAKDYIGLVKQVIAKLFTHEAKLLKKEEDDIIIMLTMTKGNIQIMTYSRADNQVVRIIPDKEAEQILMK